MKRTARRVLTLAAVAALTYVSFVGSARACSWNSPGLNPTRGIGADKLALRDYQVSAADAERIAAGRWDDIVSISKADRLRDMSWGQGGHVCRGAVDMHLWSDDHREYAYLYRLEDGRQLIVAWTCSNLALMEKADAQGASQVVPLPTQSNHAPSAEPALSRLAEGGEEASGETRAATEASAFEAYGTAYGSAWIPDIPATRSPSDDADVPGPLPTPWSPHRGVTFQPAPLPPVTPVPEPSTALLFSVGLALTIRRIIK